MIASQTPVQALKELRGLVPPYFVPALNEAIRALMAEEAKGVVHPRLES